MKRITAVLLLILISLSILTGCNNSQKMKELEKEYDAEIRLVVYDMFLQAAEAEGMVNMYLKVWKDSIEMTLDKQRLATSMGIHTSQVDAYIGEPTGSGWSSYYAFKGNFDDAIRCVSKYHENTGKNDKLVNKKSEIKDKMKELNNPPEKYNKAFDIALELYTLYEKYTDMAISPSGSLVSYSQEAKELSSEIISKYKQFEVMLPEIEE